MDLLTGFVFFQATTFKIERRMWFPDLSGFFVCLFFNFYLFIFLFFGLWFVALCGIYIWDERVWEACLGGFVVQGLGWIYLSL